MEFSESFLRHEYIDLNKSARTIARECGVSHPLVRSRLRQFGIPIRRNAACVEEPDLIGQPFGKWIVLGYAGLTKNRQRAYHCQCQCGFLQDVVKSRLLTNKAKSCRKCRRVGMAHPLRKGYREITGHFWSKCKQSAKKRNHAFLIDIEYAYGLVEQQGWRCKLSGVSIAIAQHHSEESTASLDRIDSTGDYTEGNVQWVHKDVNLMKNRLCEKRFVELCIKITEVNRGSISV